MTPDHATSGFCVWRRSVLLPTRLHRTPYRRRRFTQGIVATLVGGGTLRVSTNLYRIDRYLVFAADPATAWTLTLVAASAVAIAYFFTAYLGLALLAKPSGVAVFWPASGLAAGILVALGRRAGVAVAVGVLLGTIAANLSERSTSGNLHPQRHLQCWRGGSGGLVVGALVWSTLHFQRLASCRGFFRSGRNSSFNFCHRRRRDHGRVPYFSAILGSLAQLVPVRWGRHCDRRAVVDRARSAATRASNPR